MRKVGVLANKSTGSHDSLFTDLVDDQFAGSFASQFVSLFDDQYDYHIPSFL